MNIFYQGVYLPLEQLVQMAMGCASYTEARPYVEALFDHLCNYNDFSVKRYIDEIRQKFNYNSLPPASPNNLPNNKEQTLSTNDKVIHAIQQMYNEDYFKFKKDFGYIWRLICLKGLLGNEYDVSSANDFILFLKNTIKMKEADIPSKETLNKAVQVIIPNKTNLDWQYVDDPKGVKSSNRKQLLSYFMHLYNRYKGQ